MKPSDQNDERNDPVWELLKSSRKTEASPVFVQNTVRQVRQLAADGAVSGSILSGLVNLLRRPAFALPLAAAAVVTVAVIVNTPAPQGTLEGGVAAKGDSQEGNGMGHIEDSVVDTGTTSLTEFSFTDQVEEIDTLGDLVVVTDPSSLNEQMLADLFY